MFSFDFEDAINDVYVWTSSLCSVVVCNEVCHLFFDNRSTNFNWYNTVALWWYFKC